VDAVGGEVFGFDADDVLRHHRHHRVTERGHRLADLLVHGVDVGLPGRVGPAGDGGHEHPRGRPELPHPADQGSDAGAGRGQLVPLADVVGAGQEQDHVGPVVHHELRHQGVDLVDPCVGGAGVVVVEVAVDPWADVVRGCADGGEPGAQVGAVAAPCRVAVAAADGVAERHDVEHPVGPGER
jgi:hypothetical protein